MASRITAIRKYQPRIVLERTISTKEIARFIEDRTALNEGEIVNVLIELNHAIRHFTFQGHSVSLRGLGIFRPGMRLDGHYQMNVRIEKAVRKAMNVPGAFQGRVVNRKNIGKTTQDLFDLWNHDHPEDPVDVTA
jgi:nucleoid DNA-binding protein